MQIKISKPSNYGVSCNKAEVMQDGKEIFLGDTMDMYQLSELFKKYRIIENIYTVLEIFKNKTSDLDKEFVHENIEKIAHLIDIRRSNLEDYEKEFQEVLDAVECIKKWKNEEDFIWG